jgi:hypothetical protein
MNVEKEKKVGSMSCLFRRSGTGHGRSNSLSTPCEGVIVEI